MAVLVNPLRRSPMRLLRCLPHTLILTVFGCGADDLVLPPDTGPVQLALMRGDRQTGEVGAELPDSLLVRAVDTLGHGVPGQAVTWDVGIGGGTVMPALDTSDSNGFASTRWALGPVPGANAVRAMLSNGAFVTFTAVGNGGDGDDGGAGAPSATRSTVSADPSSIPAGTGTSTITVTVLDDEGNPVPNATVSLHASGVSSTVTQPSGPTGPDGTVRGTVAAGADAGTIAVSAMVNEAVQVSQTSQVTVTSSGSQVDHFVFRLQPHQVRSGERFGIEVALADAQGNVVPLTGILMYIGLFPVGSDVPTNNLVQGNRFVATVNGVATFNDLAITKKGHYRFRVLSDQLPELGPHGPEPYLFSLPFEVN